MAFFEQTPISKLTVALWRQRAEYRKKATEIAFSENARKQFLCGEPDVKLYAATIIICEGILQELQSDARGLVLNRLSDNSLFNPLVTLGMLEALQFFEDEILALPHIRRFISMLLDAGPMYASVAMNLLKRINGK